MKKLTAHLKQWGCGLLWARKRKSGQTTVEFSFVVFMFLLMVLATLDYAQIYYYRQSLEHGIRVAARFATLGGVLYTNQYPVGSFSGLTVSGSNYMSSYQGGAVISRNESIRNIFTRYCTVNLRTTNLLIYSWPGTNNATEASPNLWPGRAKDKIKLKVTYPLDLVTPVIAPLFPNGVYNVTVQTIVYNEPFATTNTSRYSSEP